MTAENKIARRPTLGQRYATQIWVEDNRVFWARDMSAKGVEAMKTKDWLVFVNDPESHRYGQIGQMTYQNLAFGHIEIKFTDGKTEKLVLPDRKLPETLITIPKPALGDYGWSELIRRQPGLEQFRT